MCHALCLVAAGESFGCHSLSFEAVEKERLPQSGAAAMVAFVYEQHIP